MINLKSAFSSLGDFITGLVELLASLAALGVVSEVISMGSDCYHDKNESWCKIVDWVLTAKYVGLKFKYEGEEYSMINDDEVLAVVPDPSKISHK